MEENKLVGCSRHHQVHQVISTMVYWVTGINEGSEVGFVFTQTLGACPRSRLGVHPCHSIHSHCDFYPSFSANIYSPNSKLAFLPSFFLL